MLVQAALLERLSQLQTSMIDGRPSARAALITSGSGRRAGTRETSSTASAPTAGDRLLERRVGGQQPLELAEGAARPVAALGRSSKSAACLAMPFASGCAASFSSRRVALRRGHRAPAKLRAEEAGEVGGGAEHRDRPCGARFARAAGRRWTRARGAIRRADRPGERRRRRARHPRRAARGRAPGRRLTGGGLETTSRRSGGSLMGKQDAARAAVRVAKRLYRADCEGPLARLGGRFRPPQGGTVERMAETDSVVTPGLPRSGADERGRRAGTESRRLGRAKELAGRRHRAVQARRAAAHARGLVPPPAARATRPRSSSSSATARPTSGWLWISSGPASRS